MEYKNDLYHHYRFRFDILIHIYLQHKCTTQKGIRYFYTKRSNYIKGGPSMIKSGKFISDLKDAVISYAAQQDSLDYEQLVSQFGDPQELVNDYFSEQSIDKQKRSLRFSRNVKITCTIVILIVLGCTGIFFYTLNHLAQEERNAFIHREIIILKEDDTQ